MFYETKDVQTYDRKDVLRDQDVQTKNESSFQALKPISGPQARCKDPGSSILSSGNALWAELEPVAFWKHPK